jgi:hypothetical protein
MVHIIILIRSVRPFKKKWSDSSYLLGGTSGFNLWQNMIRDVESFHIDETERTDWFNFYHILKLH